VLAPWFERSSRGEFTACYYFCIARKLQSKYHRILLVCVQKKLKLKFCLKNLEQKNTKIYEISW
jgi:hypothetical protein